MHLRGLLKIIPAGVTAAAIIAGAGTPVLPASAASRAGASGDRYNIFQKDNGSKVCLDASYEFSVCQTSADPDDPPAVQRWVLVPIAGGAYRIWNRGGTGWCLDLRDFDGPCAKGDAAQEWVRVSAGGGAYYIEHESPSGNTCLDEFWTFKTCSAGDKNQIWRFRRAS